MIQPNQQKSSQLNETNQMSSDNLCNSEPKNDKEILSDKEEFKNTNDQMINGEIKLEDLDRTNVEESNESIEVEPNQILDIKGCKERIEKIFQKINKVKTI